MSKPAAPAAKESVETFIEPPKTEADRKFILALTVAITYFIVILIPILASNSDMFKTVAAAVSGPLGTIIGYYFGTKKD